MREKCNLTTIEQSEENVNEWSGVEWGWDVGWKRNSIPYVCVHVDADNMSSRRGIKEVKGPRKTTATTTRAIIYTWMHRTGQGKAGQGWAAGLAHAPVESFGKGVWQKCLAKLTSRPSQASTTTQQHSSHTRRAKGMWEKNWVEGSQIQLFPLSLSLSPTDSTTQ